MSCWQFAAKLSTALLRDSLATALQLHSKLTVCIVHQMAIHTASHVYSIVQPIFGGGANWQSWPTYIHLLHWYSKVEWRITTPMGTLSRR